jgi:methyltransferase (TIGR00027 family)
VRAGQRSRTAQYVALVRTLLTEKGVVNDPFAPGMLTPSMRAAAFVLRRLPRHTDSAFYAALAARTLLFDGAVTRALDDGVHQVAVIGAGYDSRAWRLARPGVTFFEVDHPATQADKRRRCPAGDVRFVALDLTQDTMRGALHGGGFDGAVPALFVIEGVTMYLERDDVHTLLSELAALAAPGSRLAVNFAAPGATGSPSNRLMQTTLAVLGRFQGESFRSGRDIEDTAAFVASAGWRAVECTSLRDGAERLVAHTKLDVAGVNPAGSFVTGSL